MFINRIWKSKYFCCRLFLSCRANDLSAPLKMRAIWASPYQGQSSTDFQQMSASIRSCAPLHVAIHKCKILHTQPLEVLDVER